MWPRAAGVLVAAVLLASWEAPARAQAPLTLDEARRLVRAQNVDLREAEARAAQAEVEVERAWSRILPQVVAQGGWTRNDREIAIALPELPGVDAEPPIFQHESLFTAALEVQAQLFDPALPASLRGARSAASAGRYGVEALRERLDLATIELYHQLYTLDLLLEVSAADLEIRRENVRLVEARRAVEAATDFEVSRAQTDVLAAELELEGLREDRRALARALAELIRLPDLPGTLAAPPDPGAPALADPASLVAEALEQRADVRSARAELLAGEERVTAGRREYLPDFVASGLYRVSSEEAIDGESTAWAVTLGVRWLIFDRGLQGARIHEAQAQADGAAARLDALEAAVEREVLDAADALDTAARRSEIAQRQEELAATALEQANVGYREDVLTSLDVLEAQAALLRARNANIAARLERDVAVWRVRWATGSLVPP